MTRRLWWSVLLVVSALIHTNAQPTTIDSLRARWQSSRLADTVRLGALYEMISFKSYTDQYPDSTIWYVTQGLELAARGKYLHLECLLLGRLARAQFMQGKYPESAQHYQLALDKAVELRDTVQQIKALHGLGNVHQWKGDYARGVANFFRALALAEQLGRDDIIAIMAGSLGDAYAGMEEYGQALVYYDQSLRSKKKDKDTTGIIISYNNLALVYMTTQRYPDALQILTKALQLSKQIQLGWLQGVVYMNIGEVYQHMDEPVLAADNYALALAAHRKQKSELGEAQVRWRWASLSTTLPDSALVMARWSLEVAQKLAKQDLLANAARVLYKTYERLGRYQEALKMYQLYTITEDSLHSASQQKAVYRSEARYEIEKQKLTDQLAFEKALAQVQLTRQGWFYLMWGIIVLLLAGGAWYSRDRRYAFQAERAGYLLKISNLRESLAQHTVAGAGLPARPVLNKDQIEETLGCKLGETSWNILQQLAQNPSMGNKELAERLYLSEEGVSSSLRRMYQAFDIQVGSSKNHKVALLSKAVELSFVTD